MSIRTEWIVEVDIPQIVFDAYFGKDTCPYAHEVHEAIKGYVTAGENYYGDPYAYANFHTEKEAKACERKLTNIMQKYEKLLTSGA